VSNLDQNLGLQKLTNVQHKALPVILSGKDVLVRSQTGSGKTLAYALPIVEALQAVRPKISRADGVQAVIVVPTRELALQTYEWFIKLVKVSTLAKLCLGIPCIHQIKEGVVSVCMFADHFKESNLCRLYITHF
jgi:superfamily II DNA/RNA helicase